MHGWENANYLEPRIEDLVKPDKVDLTLPLIGLLSRDVNDNLVALFGEKIATIGHDKMLILATCSIEGEVSNQRLQLVINKHRADITQILKELCDDGYMVSGGVGRGTKYTLNTYFEGINVVNGGVNRGVNRRSGGVKTAELILKAITEQGGLNSIALGKIVGKSPRTVEKHLKNFATDDIIEYRGAAKNGGYYLK